MTCQGHPGGTRQAQGCKGWRTRLEVERRDGPLSLGRAEYRWLGWAGCCLVGQRFQETDRSSPRRWVVSSTTAVLLSQGMARLPGRTQKAQPWENLVFKWRVSLSEKLLGAQDHARAWACSRALSLKSSGCLWLPLWPPNTQGSRGHVELIHASP